MNWSAN